MGLIHTEVTYFVRVLQLHRRMTIGKRWAFIVNGVFTLPDTETDKKTDKNGLCVCLDVNSPQYTTMK